MLLDETPYLSALCTAEARSFLLHYATNPWRSLKILEYNETAKKAQLLAAHYSANVGAELLVEFMNGQADLKSKPEAEAIIAGLANDRLSHCGSRIRKRNSRHN